MLLLRLSSRPKRCWHHLSPLSKRHLSSSSPCLTAPHQKQPPQPQPQDPKQKSWLTRHIQSSPTARSAFNLLATLLGYTTPRQLAGRRAFLLYSHVCASKPDAEPDFWHTACHLPPTFQSWFTVTNLHVWLLTCRLRALPPPLGRQYVQALVDHFFIDVEDRVRAVLQPPPAPPAPASASASPASPDASVIKPYTFRSEFYVNPSNGDPTKKPRGRAPDRLVTRQMKIFKEQWMGLGLSFDLALVQGDMEMAGAMWRNLLGGRGARGIEYPVTSKKKSTYRRAVNLVGGEVENVAKIDVDKEELKDDGSGVHDFPPQEADKYVKYPEVMLDLVGYARRELQRLESLTDEEIMKGEIDKIKFGKVKN